MNGAARSLVVSLHDVSPRTRRDCATMLADLREAGAEAVSLLVVPDHHGLGHFLEDRGFCDWLGEEVARGGEPVIHGYRHRRERRRGEGPVTRLLTRCYTAGEGEFYDMGEEEAFAYVRLAEKEFREIGLAPRGFIAPAWLLGEAAGRGIRRAGMRYTVRLGGVLDFGTGGMFPSQSLVYSVRAGWRRAISKRWNPFLFRKLSDNPLLRVSLHPPDLHHPDIWRQALDLVRAALDAGREPVTYLRWVEGRAPGAVPGG